MSESADFDPGAWKGHDFGAARADIDRVAGRSYADARASGKSVADVVPQSISTDSTSPLVIVSDVTGSMGEWPKVMFSKLPYLEIEGKEYLGEDMEICFVATGDAYHDNYPLQVRPFSKGVDLKEQLQSLIIERGGGGGQNETYELAGFYCLRNIEIPKAIRPILIMIGDEAPYSYVSPDHTETYAYTTLGERLLTAELFSQLREKYDFYLIHKPYGSWGGSSDDYEDPDTKAIRQEWEKYVESDHIVNLPDPNRVVDAIFGILARATDRIDYFRGELAGRQTPEQVKTVMVSLETVHAIDGSPVGALPAGASVLVDAGDAEDADSLL